MNTTFISAKSKLANLLSGDAYITDQLLTQIWKHLNLLLELLELLGLVELLELLIVGNIADRGTEGAAVICTCLQCPCHAQPCRSTLAYESF